MLPIIVIVGPTGVGKTKLSISLAQKIKAEIINADAMQIYRGLDIGTAKVTKTEMENIPHHLLDIKEVNEEYSIYEYQKDCRQIIDKLIFQDKNIIVTGGTGLYIKAALYDYKLTASNLPKSNYDALDTKELYQKLIELDKSATDKIDKNNRRRIINAINYYEINHQSITENKTDKLLYNAIFVGLTTSREQLYKVIDNRVDEMITSGLIDEAHTYYQKNIFTKPLLSGIGYKELYSYFKGEISKEDAINLIKKNSRHYAKRQYTFFNHQLPVKWFDVNYQDFDKTIDEVYNYLQIKDI